MRFPVLRCDRKQSQKSKTVFRNPSPGKQSSAPPALQRNDTSIHERCAVPVRADSSAALSGPAPSRVSCRLVCLVLYGTDKNASFLFTPYHTHPLLLWYPMVSISSALIAFFAGHARDAPSANRRRIDARDGAQSTRCGELSECLSASSRHLVFTT